MAEQRRVWYSESERAYYVRVGRRYGVVAVVTSQGIPEYRVSAPQGGQYMHRGTQSGLKAAIGDAVNFSRQRVTSLPDDAERRDI